MYKRVLFIILCVAAVLAAVSCSMPDSGARINEDTATFKKNNTDDVMDKGPVKGGTLSLFTTPPDTLNPILTKNIYVRDMCSLIFESLINLDRSQKPSAGLASKWSVSDDGLTWIFELREDVLWHDGIPFTAEDVEFTFETILNQSLTSIYKANLQNVAAFAAVNRNTFRIILKKANSFTPELLTFPIIPKHYFTGEDIEISPRNMKPVGTGPFKFQSYNQDSSIRLVSNDKWWNAKNTDKNLPDLPYLAEIEVKVFGSSNDAVSAFQAGNVDVTGIGLGEAYKYRGRTDIILKRYESNNYEFIAFNTTKPALADKAVRQAIAYAVDRVKIINDILPGEAVISDIPVMPGTWFNDSNTMVYSCDKEKAKEILAQNGWKPYGDTLYKYINGVYTQLSFDLLVNDDNENRLKAAEKIAEQLGEAGIKVNVKKMKWEDELQNLNTKRYDMAVLGCNISLPSDIAYLYSVSPALLPEGTDISASNVSGYSNASVDQYLSEIMSESDINRRKTLFKNLKEIINGDVPYMGLYFYNKSMLYNKKIRGDISPFLWNKFSDICKWYLSLR